MKLDLKRMKELPGRVFDVAWEERWEALPHRGRALPLRETVSVRGRAYYQGGIVYLDAELDTTVEVECSRCLRPLSVKVHRREALAFEEEPAVPTESLGVPLEDFRYAHGAEELELAPYVKGLLSASLAVKPLCREECKGLCPRCGRDLNEGPCACPTDPEAQELKDPRWARLKDLLTEI